MPPSLPPVPPSKLMPSCAPYMYQYDGQRLPTGVHGGAVDRTDGVDVVEHRGERRAVVGRAGDGGVVRRELRRAGVDGAAVHVDALGLRQHARRRQRRRRGAAVVAAGEEARYAWRRRRRPAAASKATSSMPRVWPDDSVTASSLYSSLQVIPPSAERRRPWRVTDVPPSGTSAIARAQTTSGLRGSTASTSSACGATPSSM